MIGFVGGLAAARGAIGNVGLVRCAAWRKTAGRTRKAKQALVVAQTVTPVPVSAPVTPPPPPPAHLLAPAQTWNKAVAVGTMKGKLPALKVLILGIMAGFYLSLAGMISLQVGMSAPAIAAANPGVQKLLFATLGLPIGLTFVCVTGSELFTGNTSLCFAALLEGKISMEEMLRNFAVSFVGNFIGALAFVGCLAGCGLLSGPITALGVSSALKVATAKTSVSFSKMFMRGVMCNWLVCLAVWLQASSHDLLNKLLSCALPVLSFIIVGFEHSVANMFYVPFAIAAGSDVTWAQFFIKNLLPVTLGNIVGGMLLLTGSYYLAYGRKSSEDKQRV